MRLALLAAACNLAPPAALAEEPGSGVYAADCAAADEGFAVGISSDGTARVVAGGESYPDLLTSYSFFGDATPADFHIAVLFGPDRAPLPPKDGRPGWLEIWQGEAAFFALPNGEAGRRLAYCAELAEAEAIGPSFPCGEASGQVEELICADAALARQDWALAAAYRKALGRIEGDDAQRSYLKAEQRGWIKGRNDCWKESDVRACVSTSYSERHATLQARYGLMEAGETQVWACGDRDETLYVTAFMTEPPTVNLVMSDQATTGIRRRSASGARYEAPFGVIFWMKGEEAILAWPQETQRTCRHEGPLGE